MVKPKLPLAAYIRVSRVGARDEDRLRSPDLQRQAIEQYADREGLQLDMREPELDVSGSKAKRPILDAIIADVKAGTLGGLVVAKLDRLSRMPPKDRVLLFEAIEDAGGVVLSASEQLDASTPEGRFARDVFLGVARMQWEKYREGFEAAKRGSVAAGIPVNSRAAVGYVKADDRRLEPDPAVAPVVAQVFERRAMGAGPVALAALLESNGVRTSQGSTTWSKQAVYGLLSNRVYLGEVRYGKDGRFSNADAHEPIIDLATWTAAQHPNGRRPAMTGKTALLTGLVRCAGCRYSLQHTVSSHGHRVYRCTRRHAGGQCAAPVRLRAELLEDAILSTFWSWAEDVHAVPDEQSTVDLAPLVDALERSQQRLAQIDTPEAQDAYGDRWLEAVRERRHAVDRDAQALGEAQAAAAEEARQAERVPDSATLRAAWESWDVEAQRSMISAVLHTDCISVGRGTPRPVVIYQRGTEPADLPRRGYKAGPVLLPFPAELPPDAHVLQV